MEVERSTPNYYPYVTKIVSIETKATDVLFQRLEALMNPPHPVLPLLRWGWIDFGEDKKSLWQKNAYVSGMSLRALAIQPQLTRQEMDSVVALLLKLQTVLKDWSRANFFHGDLHPGNLLLSHQGLVVVDPAIEPQKRDALALEQTLDWWHRICRDGLHEQRNTTASPSHSAFHMG